MGMFSKPRLARAIDRLLLEQVAQLEHSVVANANIKIIKITKTKIMSWYVHLLTE